MVIHLDHALGTEKAHELRERLVAELEYRGDIRSDRVRSAMLSVPRHLFVPRGTPLDEAYGNYPLPIGLGQTISQPSVVAWMSEALELTGDERVLEIGTGSGYQAAVLSLLARQVFSVELFDELARRSAARLRALGYGNVVVRTGDGAQGLPEFAPFDRVIATAAAQTVPQAWLDQLDEGGILVAPVEDDWGQQLRRYRKSRGGVSTEDLGFVSFVPLLPSSRSHGVK